jgi:death-on-curing protein
VTPAAKAPRWLDSRIVLAIHDELLAQHGGLPGLRDAGLLESALSRARDRWAYKETVDLCDCASSYGFAIARNHAFSDGNKRTAFQSMYTFLGLNGQDIVARESAVVMIMVGVADGTVSESELAAWLRDNTSKRRGARRPSTG